MRWTPGLGLDGAVEAGVAWAADEGFDRVVVAHADLPLATGLRHVAGSQGVVLVPDRRADGTNVIALRPETRPSRCPRYPRAAAQRGLPSASSRNSG